MATEKEYILARFVVVFTMVVGFIAGYLLYRCILFPTVDVEYDPDVGGVVCEDVYSKDKDPHIEYGELVIEEWVSDDREVIDPEFEITTVVSVFHLFPNYAALNHTYHLDGRSDNGDDVWGWSNCEWQPDHNYAACDIYTVRPEYVLGDPAMATIGHEVWHGVAGSFHD